MLCKDYTRTSCATERLRGRTGWQAQYRTYRDDQQHRCENGLPQRVGATPFEPGNGATPEQDEGKYHPCGYPRLSHLPERSGQLRGYLGGIALSIEISKTATSRRIRSRGDPPPIQRCVHPAENARCDLTLTGAVRHGHQSSTMRQPIPTSVSSPGQSKLCGHATAFQLHMKAGHAGSCITQQLFLAESVKVLDPICV